MLEKKKTFQFVVVRTAGNKLLFDTNLKVSCESYNLNESADNGFDVELDISLKQFREYGIKTVTITTINQSTTTKPTTNDKTDTTNQTDTSTNKVTTSTTNKRSTKSNSGKKYTIKKGDTLWGIAKKYYGKGSSWTKIYNKNKSTIEKAAKNHGKKSSSNGHWIYPGTKIVIP